MNTFAIMIIGEIRQVAIELQLNDDKEHTKSWFNLDEDKLQGVKSAFHLAKCQRTGPRKRYVRYIAALSRHDLKYNTYIKKSIEAPDQKHS